MNKQKGFYWHVHHDKLIEWCYDYQGRVDYINKSKPKHEIETRLRLFKPVKGKLPKEFHEAGKKYEEAGKKFDEARKKYEEACKKFEEAGKKYGEASKKCDEVGKKCDEA